MKNKSTNMEKIQSAWKETKELDKDKKEERNNWRINQW